MKLNCELNIIEKNIPAVGLLGQHENSPRRTLGYSHRRGRVWMFHYKFRFLFMYLSLTLIPPVLSLSTALLLWRHPLNPLLRPIRWLDIWGVKECEHRCKFECKFKFRKVCGKRWGCIWRRDSSSSSIVTDTEIRYLLFVISCPTWLIVMPRLDLWELVPLTLHTGL